MSAPNLPDRARGLPGPTWLTDARVAAAERAVERGLPSSDEEVWRYSPVGDLDVDAYALVDQPSGTATADPAEILDDRAATVVLDDGFATTVELDDALASKGVRVGRIADLDADDWIADLLGPGTDAFVERNAALAPDPVLIDVPAGVVVEAPIVIVNHGAADGLVATRVVVRAGEDAEVRVAELRTSGDAAALVLPHVDLLVGRAARVGWVEVQQLARTVTQIGQQVSRVAADGRLRSAVAAFGGSYARLRTECRLEGRGASGDLLAAYFADGDQTLDFRTFQQHSAPDTSSNLMYVGAGAGSSRSVYTGTIRVEPDARGTDAVQANRNVKLSDDAWAESVPNLEILNNEVRCAHASSVGPVDPDQRFYLESRGVPPAVAERLIVSGYFDAVVTALAVPGLAQRVQAAIDDKLEETT